MSGNRVTPIIKWSLLLLTTTSIPIGQMATDSLKIVSRGNQNFIMADSLPIPPHADTTVVFINIKGTTTQTGRQNKVEISASKDTVSQKSKSTIVVKQTCNNNSVKINSE